MELKENVDIRCHTTFGVGGVVRYFIELDSADELPGAVLLARKQKLPFRIIAGGSNLVCGDGLLDCTLIKIGTPKAGGSITVKGNKVTCDAGTALMDLINVAISNGLAGMETLSGIPGTVGGAIVGNAGAYGQAISDKLEKVLIFDGKDKKWLKKKECKFTYRNSIFKDKNWYILSAVFKLERGNKLELKKKSEEIITIRDKKYPPGLRTPGSFFKNILIEKMPKKSLKFLPKDRDYFGKVPAWFFLNQVGARGMKEGGITIADFHGNYLINSGGATFKDVKTLADKLKKLVKDKFGVELEEEVIYITG